MPASALPHTKLRFTRRLKTGFLVGAVMAGAALMLWAASGPSTFGSNPPTKKIPSPAEPSADAQTPDHDTVTLAKSAWKVAGVKIAPAAASPLATSVEVTGQIALNEDRIAHIYPLVEGRVNEVHVRFGQNVEAGDVLAVIHSKEVGERKLQLVQSRLAREIAAINRDRAIQVDENAQELIATLESGVSVDEIETKFQGRPMGSFRERLVTAYAELAKAAADFERIAELTQRGVTATKDLTSVQANRDAARATYTALLDQSKFESRQQATTAEQALREADARVAASEAALAILGYSKSDLEHIDPAAEGQAISHYPVIAPFDGTILTKDIVLMETVDATRQLFEIADLSSVWIVADVYERHLPVIANLEGESVRVRCDVLPDLSTDATVFFTGETVEESTRTVRLRAQAPNPDRRLKPGLFVAVELPGGESRSVVQVPETAIVEHQGKRFVFVHVGGDSFERRDVATGERSAGQIEIVSGLVPGESIAVGGGFALKSQLLSDLLSEE